VNYGFTYNPAGQVASKSLSNGAYAYGGNSSGSSTYVPNQLNQITSMSGSAGSSSFAYDGRGNLATTAAAGYSYDQENNLTSTASGASLTYDDAGRLASITNGGVTRKFLYAGNQVVGEYGSAGNMIRRFVPNVGVGNETLVWFEGLDLSDPRYLIADPQGSVVTVTNNAGKSLAINTYDAYGMPGSANLGRIQYTGQMWMSEVGLYNYRARAYSPSLRRFLQADPAGYGAGMNLYAYVGGDPINATDPSGMCDDVMACVNVTGSLNGSWSDGWSALTANMVSQGAGGPGDNVKTVKVGVTGSHIPVKFKQYTGQVYVGDPDLPGSTLCCNPVDFLAAGRFVLAMGAEGLATVADFFIAGREIGLPPDGLAPPVDGPFEIGPSSRSSDPGQSLWDPNGGEWRYFPEDDYRNPHWDYNPWSHPYDQWQNVPIDNLPTHK